MKAFALLLLCSTAAWSAPAADSLALVDSHGAPFTLASLRGQAVALSFVYSSCPSPKMCPLTMSLNKELQAAWAALPAAQRPALHFVIATLDPVRDTPPVLDAFAARHGLDAKAFTLVTGSRATMADFVSAFSAAGHPGEGGAIDHTPTLVLLKPDLTEQQRWVGNAWTTRDVLAALMSKPVEDVPSAWKTEVVTLSDFKIDRTFVAMTGPTQQRVVKLPVSGSSQQVWLKGLQVEVLDQAQKQRPLTSLCHAWLTVVDETHDARAQQGLLTLSEGMGTFAFPKGFGVPMSANGDLELLAQALNDEPGMKQTVSYRFTIRYLEQPAAAQPLQALSQRTVATMGNKLDIKDGAICDASVDGQGRATHYVVKPGASEYVNDYPKGFFPTKARIHFIKLHLHRFGQSVTLFDVTAGKPVWSGRASYDAKKEIEKTDSYSSVEGLEVFPDHEYRVVAKYVNPLPHNVDGMGVLRLYLH